MTGRLLVLGAACVLGLPAEGCGRPVAPPATIGPLDLGGSAEGARWMMGTLLRVQVQAPSGVRAVSLIERAMARAEAIDRLLSGHRADSVLSELNRAASRGPARVERRLLKFIKLAQHYSAQTYGAFDITAGPLITLYGRLGLPSGAQVARALARVGYRRVTIAGAASRVERGTRLDAGAIGKGVAVDAMIALLRRAGVTRAFIDFGGSSFFGLGTPRGGWGWAIRLEARPLDRRSDGDVVLLRDEALSSSRSFRCVGGHAEFHIVDPRSGVLIRRRRYVAVKAASAAEAEVWSTALVVDPALRPPRSVTMVARVVARKMEHRSQLSDDGAATVVCSAGASRPVPDCVPGAKK